MEKIILKKNPRILSGHLWIFSNELPVSPKQFEPGSLVEVSDKKGEFIGIGYVNPVSLIAVRLLTRQKEQIDRRFFRDRVLQALERRKRYCPGADSFRAVYSEADHLPGLIVDKYNKCLAVQLLTLGMERFREAILDVLDEVFSPEIIVLRNDSQSRHLEGLELHKELLKGELPPLPRIKEGVVELEIDPMSGQKTGFFLDQRENRIALAGLVPEGARGLDLFCYSGAWGLQLAAKGAYVKGVDDSEHACCQAARNAEINGLSERTEYLKADVFDFLKAEAASGAKYDFVVLDPPAFVKSRAKISEAMRGYRRINELAMRIVKNGGLLATSSCSHHIDRPSFLNMLLSASNEAGRAASLIEFRSQGKDHPVLLPMPETEYLKCAFVELS
ncbi:MAG: class I SAM-dependent rRNA methyltransferase [Nitrospiraceae bacterium]|nr:class I SAM-dependent rRNA methyltransferase [Nitrospiraceae bacterium]